MRVESVGRTSGSVDTVVRKAKSMSEPWRAVRSLATVTPSRCSSPTMSPKSRPCFAGSASTAATICQPDFWTSRRDTAQPIGPRPICITRILCTPCPHKPWLGGGYCLGMETVLSQWHTARPHLPSPTGHECIQDSAAQRRLFSMLCQP